MAYPGKRDGLAQKVETAAQEAERLGLTTATLILRMARLEIDRAESKEIERIQGAPCAAGPTEGRNGPVASQVPPEGAVRISTSE